jgi:hypothetical protein
MPTTTNITDTGSFTIDAYVYSLDFEMFGATGGGENILGNASLTRTSGTSGGTTSFLGFSLSGGVGGGGTTKNGGGQGGEVTVNYNWPNTGTSISSANGNRGSLSTGGIGAYIGSVKQDGGNGSSGFNTYTSTSTHFFNNQDVAVGGVPAKSHSFVSTSADIILSYQNPGASSVGKVLTPSNGKYYSLTFAAPYANNLWTFSITTTGLFAAGGGSGGRYYSLNGTNNKDAGGIDIWFQTSVDSGDSYGSNSYIRDFTITTTGLKPGATGRGGGGAAVVYGSISYETLEETTNYLPGSLTSAVIGTAGIGGGTTGGCADGLKGKITVVQTIFPQVYLSSNIYLCTPTSPSAILSWITAGDADAIRWPTNGDITNGNLESNSTVTPTVTTTYTAEAYNTSNSDLVSFNPEASVTIVVISAPSIGKFQVPDQIDYGSNAFNVIYETEYANTNLKLEFFNAGYTAGPNSGSSFLQQTVVLTTAGSAETGNENIDADGTISYSPQWDNFGPRSIVVRLTAEGDGGSVIEEETIGVVIDETPDNITIDETDDALKDQDPVYTPETEVLSEMYYVDDIDIPVEIKSNYPIKVDINKDDNWTKVRQI